MDLSFQNVFFYILAGISVGSAIMVITRKNPVSSALYLVLNLFCLAGIYLTLNAQFVAVIQVMVYAGAIMVLFLFVIMLLNLGNEDSLGEKVSFKTIAAFGLGFAVLMEILYIVGSGKSDLPAGDMSRSVEIGTVEYLGHMLFKDFLFPFEVTGVLLLVAIVGAMILAKRKID